MENLQLTKNKIKLDEITVIWKNNPDMIAHNQSLIDLIKESFPNTKVNDFDGHKIVKENVLNSNVIINLAGDGHYLNAARYILEADQYLLGFTFENSNSYGHYNMIRGAKETLRNYLEQLKEGNVQIGKYARLDVFLNGELIDLVLNEVWEKSASGANLKHHLKINGLSGEYAHGGFGVATASGRDGMIGRVNPLEIDAQIPEEAIVYRAGLWTPDYMKIKEERIKGLQGNSIYDGILDPDKSIIVTSLNRNGSAHIVCDGRHELLPNPRIHYFNKGDVLEVKLSKRSLSYLY